MFVTNLVLILPLFLAFPILLHSLEAKSNFDNIHLERRSGEDSKFRSSPIGLVGKSTYSSYEGERAQFPALESESTAQIWDSDLEWNRNQMSPDRRVFHLYILNREKAKKKKKEEKKKMMMQAQKEMYPSYHGYQSYGLPHAPPQESKEKAVSKEFTGNGPLAALLIAYIILIIYIFSYDIFDKKTGLGRLGELDLASEGRAIPSILLTKLFSMDRMFTSIIESIDLAEVAFLAVGIDKPECQQLAFCNIRKVLNVFPQMEKYLDSLGYSSYANSTYASGDIAGREKETCKKSFPRCRDYKYSL